MEMITIGNSAFPLWLPFALWAAAIVAIYHTSEVWDEKNGCGRLATTWEALAIIWQERFTVLASLAIVAGLLCFLDQLF